jgi:predicted Zn-dependent protease
MRLRSAALAIGLVAWWPLVSTGDDGFRAGGSYPLHVELVRVFGELSDDRYARIVERVGRRAVEARGAKPDRFRFTLLDSPELRAFALPGGFAYVTRGLLATFDSEAQLERTLADLLPEAERADPGRRERDALFWAPFRGIGWPAQDGPRVALPDLVDRALERARSVDVAELPPSTGEERAAFLAELDGLPVGPDPAHGVLEPDGRYLHTFPTLLGAEVVAERSLTDMERERKLDVVDLSRASGAIGGLPYVAFEYRLVRARREHPVRCVWIQDRRRLYRLLGVVELDVLWRSPGLVERIQGSFRRARADEPSELAQLRLRLHVAGDGETLEGVAARYPGGWSAAELATLNRLDAAAPLSSGALLKVVRLEPLSEKPAN